MLIAGLHVCLRRGKQGRGGGATLGIMRKVALMCTFMSLTDQAISLPCTFLLPSASPCSDAVMLYLL